jgi:hypothetical protein
VVDESLAVGHIVTVNVWGGRTWAGTEMELFYQQTPLDLALPIKRTSHQSPVCCTFCLQTCGNILVISSYNLQVCSQPSPSPPAEKDTDLVADNKLNKPVNHS